MPIPIQRKGIPGDFHIYPDYDRETTMGNREQVTWTSIRHLCASEIAHRTLKDIHGITDRKTRAIIIANIKLYIIQAFEFYTSASNVDSNTSPLFYYYSFMNLAKALCEIKHADFRKMDESYRHGLSWRPNSMGQLVQMQNESVTISTRGIWHVLSEILTGKPCTAQNPTNFMIKDLFSLCPEINTEFERAYYQESRLIVLEKLGFLYRESSEIWLKLSLFKQTLKEQKLTIPQFLELISNTNYKFIRVQDERPEYFTFESKTIKTVPPQNSGFWYALLIPEIRKMNLFVHPEVESMEYFVPIQNRLPIQLHQLVLLYTIVFWLGSLVRYDPQSVSYLQDSRYWMLVEGFLSQSRLLLLELFEWEFYQKETHIITC